MSQLPTLITDLALILMTAAVVSILFRKLKQPLILGYILAGFIVSPFFVFTPNVVDTHNLDIWAEIGVIFLLFSLGLEFSFKRLLKEGSSVIITALFKIIATLLLGFLLGKVFGWTNINSLFLGGMLASSSTIITIKSFEELGEKSKKYTKTVIGILVLEDILVVVLMVLLSTISVTQKVEGKELFLTILKLGFFLVLWLVMGIFIIPTLITKTKNLLNEEVFLILSLGLCFGMVVMATSVGFSAELGAFIMGSILAETTSAEKIENYVKPLKDLFGAIFFVTIGMMINPAMLWQYKWFILIIIFVTIFGKFLFTITGALLSGQSLRHSVQVASALSQVSEFAFIVAALGMSLGVISDFLLPVAIGAAVVTTFTTPIMIKNAEKTLGFFEKIIPKSWQKFIDAYSSKSSSVKTTTVMSNMMKKILTIVLLNGVIIYTVSVGVAEFLVPLFDDLFTEKTFPEVITLILVICLISPFLWAVMFKLPGNVKAMAVVKSDDFNRRRLTIVQIVRIIVGLAAIVYLGSSSFGIITSLLVVLPCFIIFFILCHKFIRKVYHFLEQIFMVNFHGRETAENEKNKH